MPYNYIDDWADFIIYKQYVDVKSCRITQKFSDKRTKTQSYKIGRFDFTQEQIDKKVYTAFFVRNNNDFLFLGIAKLTTNSRYISIHKTRELDLLTIKEFIKIIKEV